MKISLNWLQDFIEFTADLDTVTQKICVSTAEVDEVEVQGALLNKCCVGKVKELRKHPDADRLTLCTVETDDGEKPVVCGGENLREGMLVAFAHIGATVCWHGTDMMTLEKCKIRGEVSEGMICAADELDLAERFPEATGKNIIDLGDGDGVGTDLREYLGLTDTVLHIDNHAITHRPDLFSHVGFARECVALGVATWKKDPTPATPEFPADPLRFAMKRESPEKMPRYVACSLQVDSLGETPQWMVQRLEATGWRSVSLPVDITNYVMMEWGDPLHSFDQDDIVGDVVFREAEEGETIQTLDEKVLTLPEGSLILADDEGIFDLLGIMGGLRSSTKDGTKNIYLHSATLDPMSIRRAVIATGQRTDAATTFEKGVPAIAAELGFYKAIELFLEYAPGAKLVSQMDSVGDNGEAPTITTTVEAINRRLGAELTLDTCVSALEGLGCAVVSSENELTVRPPLHRLRDLKEPHDLSEEVGRIVGYNELPTELPDAHIAPPPRNHTRNALRRSLKEMGAYELLPLSLISPDLVEKSRMSIEDCVRIENPLGEELSIMQPSVLPRLLEHAQRQQGVDLQTFTLAHTFARTTEQEHEQLGYYSSSAGILTVQTELVSILATLGYSVSLSQTDSAPSYAHPGQFAHVTLSSSKGDEVIGELFTVHPAVRNSFDLPDEASVVLLDMDLLLAHAPSTVVPEKSHSFPPVSYDVTIDWSHGASTADLLTKAGDASELLEDISVMDLYSDTQMDAGKVALTVRCTYRSSEKTLTEAEAQSEHGKVLSVLGV